MKDAIYIFNYLSIKFVSSYDDENNYIDILISQSVCLMCYRKDNNNIIYMSDDTFYDLLKYWASKPHNHIK